jgi:multidrug resistance efflux pump
VLLANEVRPSQATGVVRGISQLHGGVGSMSILAVIRREEKKVKKQMAELRGDLTRLQSAAKAMGATTNRELTSAKKQVLSASARTKMSKAAKKRWAKIKAGAKKAAS